MTYIEYLNRFNQWLEEDSPTDKAVILYYAMLNMFNRRGWPRWAGVDTQKLMRMCRTTSNNTAYRARDCLVSAGFLEYRPGKKGKATEYGLCAKYYIRNCTENGTESGTENGTESGTENGTPNKTKDLRLKTEEEAAREDFSDLYDRNLAQVAQHFESTIGYSIPHPAVSAVMEWLKTMPPELICAALDEAAIANAKNWNYAAACLRAWNAKGIRTLDALKAAQAARQKPEKPKELPRDEKSYDVLAAFMEDEDGLR